MNSDQAFEVSWSQLPQRSIWLKANPATTASREAPRSTDPIAPTEVIRSAKTPAGKQPGGWEYRDHTADVQIHSWGVNLGEAFGAAVVGMFAYMVELDEIDNDLEVEKTVTGLDLHNLLYRLMDECLYTFCTEQFATKQVIVKSFDRSAFIVKVLLKGGTFDPERHSQGTEVKAITYSNLQVVEEAKDRVETYVIVDI